MHAQNVARQDGAELVAVASATASASDRGGGRARAERAERLSHEQLAASDDVEAVVLCCRARDHVRYAVPLLEAGKHLLLEKPGATTLADHDRLRAAGDAASGSVLQIAYMRRFDRCSWRPIGSWLRARSASRWWSADQSRSRVPGRGGSRRHGRLSARHGRARLRHGVLDARSAAGARLSDPSGARAPSTARDRRPRQCDRHRQLRRRGDCDLAYLSHVRVRARHTSRDHGRGGLDLCRQRRRGPGRDDPRCAQRDRFPSDYQARFRDAFRAEIAHFVEACAAVQTGAASTALRLETVHAPRRPRWTTIGWRWRSASPPGPAPWKSAGWRWDDWPWPSDEVAVPARRDDAMTASVRAAVMKEPGVIAVEQFPLPDPEPGAVVLEMSMSGICGTDKHTFRGETLAVRRHAARAPDRVPAHLWPRECGAHRGHRRRGAG